MRIWLATLVMTVIGGCDARTSSVAQGPHPSPLPEYREREKRGKRVGLATTQEVIESKIDLWGESALREPSGPTYEFFEKLLPPIRYVDADFRVYPLVLSWLNSLIKGRIVSDGSAINALSQQPNWANEQGTPVRVLVGRERGGFGEDLGKLRGPHYLEGYLPIISLAYEYRGENYGEEVFASVDEKLPGGFAKFDFPAADQGRIELRILAGNELLSGDNHVVRDGAGNALVAFDENWDF